MDDDIIESLNKAFQKPKPVLKDGSMPEGEEALDLSAISYYKIPVEYEITGNFLGYIRIFLVLPQFCSVIPMDNTVQYSIIFRYTAFSFLVKRIFFSYIAITIFFPLKY